MMTEQQMLDRIKELEELVQDEMREAANPLVDTHHRDSAAKCASEHHHEAQRLRARVNQYREIAA